MGYVYRYKKPEIEKKPEPKNKYQKEYHWFDNFYLTARLFDQDKKPMLVISAKDDKDQVIASKTISCVHVVISETNLDTLVEHQSDSDWQKYIIETSNEKKQINLDTKERFFALNSWVQGIAESGIKSIYIDSDIPVDKNWSIPIISQLLEVVFDNSNNFIFEFLEYVIKQSKYENMYSESYLITNLKMILPHIQNLEKKDHEKIKELIISKELPVRVYFEFYKYLGLNILESSEVQDFIINVDLSKYINKESKNVFFDTLIKLAENPSAYKKYDIMFDLLKKFLLIYDNNKHHISTYSLNSIDFSNHYEIFDLIIDSNLIEDFDITSNISISKYPRFDRLFTIKKEGFLERLFNHRNLSNFIFKNYLNEIKELINSEFERVREAIVKHFELADLIPNEYDHFFDDISGNIRSYYLANPKTHNRDFVKRYLENPVKRRQLLYFIFTEGYPFDSNYSDILDNYDKNLFKIEDIDFLFNVEKNIKSELAACKLVTSNKEFEKIIPNNIGIVFRNPNIILVPGFESKYINLENYILYEKEILKNPSLQNLKSIREIQDYLSGKLDMNSYLMPDEKFKAKKIFKKLTDKIGYCNIKIRERLASNLIFVNNYGYKILFKDHSKSVLQKVVSNELAPINHPKEYIKFFESDMDYILENLIKNQNAFKQFPDKFEYLIERFKNIIPVHKVLFWLSDQEYLVNTKIFTILRGLNLDLITKRLERTKKNLELNDNEKDINENSILD